MTELLPPSIFDRSKETEIHCVVEALVMRIVSAAEEFIGAERVEPEGRKLGDSHLSSASSLKYMRIRARREECVCETGQSTHIPV